ncbi:hypothetical protein E2R66_26140 [Mucilaginibacter psychrotolerans]|uniref:Uncharacterized protein n=1 Tax=Mucilaginibacter psychrotolerans TaxID=1524096 RepID=A0A4Y8S458_9SPHI|nr:hypothetical protein E2R66_26140 [Mucilaginibacter psychrotolerans]
MISFRNDHTFEMHSTGVFFYSNWKLGAWDKNGDTLKLKWHGQPAPALGSTLLIDSGYLKPLDKTVNERFRHIRMFCLGYCKGDN